MIKIYILTQNEDREEKKVVKVRKKSKWENITGKSFDLMVCLSMIYVKS